MKVTLSEILDNSKIVVAFHGGTVSMETPFELRKYSNHPVAWFTDTPKAAYQMAQMRKGGRLSKFEIDTKGFRVFDWSKYIKRLSLKQKRFWGIYRDTDPRLFQRDAMNAFLDRVTEMHVPGVILKNIINFYDGFVETNYLVFDMSRIRHIAQSQKVR